MSLAALLVIAHAGHWLVSVAYMTPLVFLVGIIVAGKVRDRRRRSDESSE
jgi:hypothetical protein